MKVVATAETLGFISIVVLKVIVFNQSNAYILTVYVLDVQTWMQVYYDFIIYIAQKFI